MAKSLCDDLWLFQLMVAKSLYHDLWLFQLMVAKSLCDDLWLFQLTVAKSLCEKRIYLLGGPDYKSYSNENEQQEYEYIPGKKV